MRKSIGVLFAVLFPVATARCSNTPAPGDAGPADAALDGRQDAARDRDGATPGDAAPDARRPTPSADGTAILAAIGCVPTRTFPGDGSGGSVPSLPFYQPGVDSAHIDQVVVHWASGLPLPTANQFNVLDRWHGGDPIVPITSWALSQYTGFDPGGALASFQRGNVDAFGESGVQAAGTRVGLWLNTLDHAATFFGGSNSLNVGCGFGSGPYPQLFSTPTSELDVSFDVGVQFDGSTGNAHVQAYYQMIVSDRSHHCRVCDQPDNQCDCAFSLSIGYYTQWLPEQAVIADGTHTSNTPLAVTSLNHSGEGWFHSTPDSIGYQTHAPFPAQPFHVRISAAEFMNIRDAIVGYARANIPSSPYIALSTNVLDYGLSTVGTNGEAYDPCADDRPGAACGAGRDHAQLGMSVGSLRVTSTVPHQTAGFPSGLAHATSTQVVFRDPAGNIGVFSKAPEDATFALTSLPATDAAGDPMGFVAHQASRVVYRDQANHVRESYLSNDIWTTWDITSTLGLADSASDPRGYADANDWPHVVYRDAAGDVADVSLDAAGWHSTNVTRMSHPAAPPAAIGSPMGYLAAGGAHIVFLDAQRHVRQMDLQSGAWNQWDMTTAVAGADVAAYSDPRACVDPEGRPRVVFRDINGVVHEVSRGTAGWSHRDLTALTGATAAIGSPSCFASGDATCVVYRGTDNHLHEILDRADAPAHYDLHASVRGALPMAGDPMGFVGGDGVPRVEYNATDGQLHEFFYSSTAAWLHRDL